MLTAHVCAAQALVGAVLPGMLQRKHGKILFTASMASLFGIPLVMAYSAAKGAYVGMVRSLATEVSSQGVRVNAIAPGWIDSEMMREALAGDPTRRDKILGRTPMGCFGEADDVGNAAVYLRSPAAKFVTGVVLPVDGTLDRPIPNGMVWNMVYDLKAAPGTLPPIMHEELWRRHGEFLGALIPVAEDAGVTLAAHPDDPPMPTVRGQRRLAYQPQLYQWLIDRHASPRNGLEFCLGTLAEMTGGDLYEAVEACSRQRRIAYVHCRNGRGKVPRHWETFIDEGDVDVRHVLQILKRNGFEGVIIPDHGPQMTCAAPWHARMAYACGWLKAVLDSP